jgi:DNA-binding transcriptional regulator YiaG
MSASSPTPEAIRYARRTAKLTQQQAGFMLGCHTGRTWQEWEGGRRNMPPAKWALFQMLIGSAT